LAPSLETIIPENDAERVAAVQRYQILDTPPDGSFDRITALAARLLRVPISTITIVDTDRIWFKSKHGIDANQIGRDPGLCASAICHEDTWIVSDAASDPRTLENPLVRGELGLRYYVGAPLTTQDGFNLGTLNVIDREPREPSPEEIATLEDLAAIVVDELELRLAALREERNLEGMRTDFLTTAAHELRTPLAAVYGAAATLSQKRATSEEARDLLIDTIEQQSERLATIVENILLASRLETGRIQIVREPFDPSWLARSAVETARARMPSSRTIDLIASDDTRQLDSDPGKVRQILVNLIDNAGQYSPGDTPIEVRVETDEHSVRFVVRDEGLGIPAEEQNRIFDRFHRLDPEQTRGASGTGLGLYIARELARELGGLIVLESAPGEGSTFTLELPLQPR
jgi:signal transduction histidine kinase